MEPDRDSNIWEKIGPDQSIQGKDGVCDARDETLVAAGDLAEVADDNGRGRTSDWKKRTELTFHLGKLFTVLTGARGDLHRWRAVCTTLPHGLRTITALIQSWMQKNVNVRMIEARIRVVYALVGGLLTREALTEGIKPSTPANAARLIIATAIGNIRAAGAPILRANSPYTYEQVAIGILGIPAGSTSELAAALETYQATRIEFTGEGIFPPDYVLDNLLRMQLSPEAELFSRSVEYLRNVKMIDSWNRAELEPLVKIMDQAEELSLFLLFPSQSVVPDEIDPDYESTDPSMPTHDDEVELARLHQQILMVPGNVYAILVTRNLTLETLPMEDIITLTGALVSLIEYRIDLRLVSRVLPLAGALTRSLSAVDLSLADNFEPVKAARAQAEFILNFIESQEQILRAE